MITKTLDRETSELKKEVELLRSFVIGQAGKDPEGNYNPVFVKRAMKAILEKPIHEFKSAKSFLEHIRSK